MGSVLKKKTNGYNYKYTEMSTIHEELEAQGIKYYQYIDYDANADADYIYTVIKYGDKESTPRRGCRVIVGGEQKMTAAQAQGSAITYARRYSLLMALGWATEDDDGAATGKQTPKAAAPPNRIDFKEIRERLKQINTVDELTKYWVSLKLSQKQAGFLESDFAKRKAEIGGENGLE